MKTCRMLFRLALMPALVVLLQAATLAANPFLTSADDRPVAAAFRGTEWNDEFGADELTLTARVSTQRMAQFPWGAVFKITFSDLHSKAPEKREIRAWYFIATDDAIALLNEEPIEPAIEKLAALPKAPKFEDDDLYGLSKGTKKWGDAIVEKSITVKGEVCTYQYTHNSGHFTTVRWKKGVGLMEFAQGQGAHQNGWRLKREVASVKKTAK
jgi:hypothetical protein